MHDVRNRKSVTLSEEGRERLFSNPREPLFVANWERVLFIHFEVDEAKLQAAVPFELDLYGGGAFVSLVAFTMRGMRLWKGGWLGKLMVLPIATHSFLNVRTYVRHAGEPGIYFLAEWLPNPLSVVLGPVFGLPYRLGHTSYEHYHERGELSGKVRGAGAGLRYEASVARSGWGMSPSKSLDEFLLERYTAFTDRGRRRGRFRIWHEPWRQQPVTLQFCNEGLLGSAAGSAGWSEDAAMVGANYSPGAKNVLIGWPHRLPEDLSAPRLLS